MTGPEHYREAEELLEIPPAPGDEVRVTYVTTYVNDAVTVPPGATVEVLRRRATARANPLTESNQT